MCNDGIAMYVAVHYIVFAVDLARCLINGKRTYHITQLIHATLHIAAAHHPTMIKGWHSDVAMIIA